LQIEKPKTPPFKGFSPPFSGNNYREGASNQEAFELGWESKDNDIDESSGVQVMPVPGANIWPSEEHVPGFRQTVLDF
jgi:hypothetical protein